MESNNSTRAEIRTVADTIRRRWAVARGNTDEDSPLASDLKALAKKLFRLSVVASRSLGSNVLGKVNRRTKVIQYRATLDDPANQARCSFVIAHEIGHYVLGHRADIFEETPRTVDDEVDSSQLDVRDGVYRAYSDRERQELEANLFAGELLAPTRALARAIADDPDWSVAVLAERFGVTRPAIENRLAAVLLQGGPEVFAASIQHPHLSSTSVNTIRTFGSESDYGQPNKELPVPDGLQLAAVTEPCPALVLAGPGSGKTAVLVARYVRLVREEKCPPTEILALTYTNKAAAEMRARLVAALSGEWTAEQLSQIQVTTLHALGLDLITRHVQANAGLPTPTPPRLLTEGDALFLLRLRLAQLPLGSFEDLHDPLTHLRTVLKCINKAKQEGWTPERLRTEAAQWTEKLDREAATTTARFSRLDQHLTKLIGHRDAVRAQKSALPRVSPRAPATDATRMKKESLSARDSKLNERVKRVRKELTPLRQRLKSLQREVERAARAGDAAEMYEAYERELAAAGYADFNDLITHATRIIEQDAIQADSKNQLAIRDQWRYILIDEFQDINWLCGRLLCALDGGRRIVWAVGDPEQSIYRFLGASPRNLAQFAVDYPGSSCLQLTVNYRSVEEIVRVGRAIWEMPKIAGTLAPPEKPEAHAHRGALRQGTTLASVTVLVADTGETEAAALAASAAEHRASGGRLSDIALLCRTRRQAGALSAAFEERAIPTTWGGELFERSGFRDLMCVLLLACGDARGLERLARLPEYALAPEDRALLLRRAAERDEDGVRLGLRWALRAARKGQIPGLSSEASIHAQKLHTLMARLNEHRRKPEGKAPWRMLAAYLFTHSQDSRDLLRRRLLALRDIGGTEDATGELPLSLHRDVSAFSQTAALARGFAGRARLLEGDSVNAFIDYVTTAIEHDCLETQDEVPVPVDAVRVLTIHQSKGLEWPIVFVPNLAKERFPPIGRTPLPLPPSLLRPNAVGATEASHDGTDPAPDEEDTTDDERCLFYVAITRARDRLILSRADIYNGDTYGETPFLTDLISSTAASPHIVNQRCNGPSRSASTGKRVSGDSEPATVS